MTGEFTADNGNMQSTMWAHALKLELLEGNETINESNWIKLLDMHFNHLTSAEASMAFAIADEDVDGRLNQQEFGHGCAPCLT